MGRHACNPARDDFACFGDEALQEIGVFVVDGFDCEVDAATWHRAVGAPEVRSALRCFWLHGLLLGFPVKGMPLKVRVVFFLLDTPGSLGALFVAFAHVARNRLSLRTRFSAFQRDDFLCHD